VEAAGCKIARWLDTGDRGDQGPGSLPFRTGRYVFINAPIPSGVSHVSVLKDGRGEARRAIALLE